MNRRHFVKTLGLAPLGSPLLAELSTHGVKGKAEHCIFIWLGGGMSQADTFDPKNVGDNKASTKKPALFIPPSKPPSLASNCANTSLAPPASWNT